MKLNLDIFEHLGLNFGAFSEKNAVPIMRQLYIRKPFVFSFVIGLTTDIVEANLKN